MGVLASGGGLRVLVGWLVITRGRWVVGGETNSAESADMMVQRVLRGTLAGGREGVSVYVWSALGFLLG